MNRLIFLIFSLVVLSLKAQDQFEGTLPLDSIPNSDSFISAPVDSTEETDSITLPDYESWKVAKIDGKLKMQGLPLSPSLKIFMEKDSLIDISIRAPFVGEAGRLVITTDSVIAVNKMNKTYVSEGISDFLRYYPGGISNVQDLLLARFFLPGVDVMQVDLEELIDIYYEDNQFNVVPKGVASIPGIIYGYVVDELFNPLWLVVLPEERQDIELDVQYTYNRQGYDIIIAYLEGDKKRDLTLELKNPEWKGESPKAIDLNKKFRRLSFSDFLKSF